MLNLTVEEAKLVRYLTTIFGQERIVCKASLNLVCGGQFSGVALNGLTQEEFNSWAKRYRCLVAITNDEGDPRIIVDFLPGIFGVLEMSEVEHRERVRPILNHNGLQYVELSLEEFEDLLDPSIDYDFFGCLQERFEAGEIILKNS